MTCYDAIVVGLGGMGAATLEALSRRGMRVLGLECQQVLRHGKGRSHASSRGFRQSYPDDTFRELAASSRAYWERLPPQDGRRIFEPCGATISAPSNHPMIVGVRGAARALGARCTTYSAAQQAANFPGLPEHFETIFEPDAGWIRASAAIEAMCAMAVRQGAKLRCGACVDRVEHLDTGAMVHMASSERLLARAVILCTAGHLVQSKVPWSTPLVFRRQVEHWFDVRGVPGVSCLEQGEGMFHALDLSVEGIDGEVNLYGMLEQPGLLKCCLQSPLYDACHEAASQCAPVGASELDAVHRTLWSLWPSARGRTSLLRSRVGWNVETPSRRFHFGPGHDESSIIRAQAFCGHGFKMFPALAERVCDFVENVAK